MPNFFFPCIGLASQAGSNLAEGLGAALWPREWATSTFDFASLGASHKIHFSWHLLEVFLHSCHLEIEIRDVPDVETAQERVRILQSMLYLQWVSPFMIPFAMTHGLRDYSGLNFRDRPSLVGDLPAGLQSGFTSKDGTIQGWLHEPSLECISVPDKRVLSSEAFLLATEATTRWQTLEQRHPALSVARRALQTSPMIPDLSSSLLHVWQGIEALFPTVSTEVSFRLALLVSQLCVPVRSERIKTYAEAKASYNQRSRAAHGNGGKLTYQHWLNAWDILVLCLSACLEREGLPTEEALTLELLG
ncbi:hypothetical protein [Novosphingobium sp. KACC 22771]|uniref:hypothetical protein n=1 Tax=Novosphingobium sp. KACC 22771 TaxID=3025670 RepID=UPI0023662000|nr:hypothetical protein [Novosphingobium sp. KACC 22771]WDF74205.1 hypothetical protein PQ467_19815 [Novosphingobium sp. KACC 22771]